MDIEQIKRKMPGENEIYDLADLFKVLGDQTRTKILTVLEISELCVNDIADAVGMTKSAVSHQLRILRSARLIKARRQGKEIFYSLDDNHVSQIFECALIHINEERG
jgi:DNA-binding transcriptional ArsR family regulator